MASSASNSLLQKAGNVLERQVSALGRKVSQAKQRLRATAAVDSINAFVNPIVGNGRDWDPHKLILRWLGHLDPLEWVHDAAYTACLHCKSKLVPGHRHHCRLCGQMFCSRCSSKYHVPQRFRLKNKKGPVRVCYACRNAALEHRRGFELFRRQAQALEAASSSSSSASPTSTLPVSVGSQQSLSSSQLVSPSLEHVQQIESEYMEEDVDVAYTKQHRGTYINPDITLLGDGTTEHKGVLRLHLPSWTPRGTYTDCFKCRALFSKGHEHNCRVCGRLACSECSYKRAVPPKFKKKNKPGPQRVCDECHYLVYCGAQLVELPAPKDDELLRVSVAADKHVTVPFVLDTEDPSKTGRTDAIHVAFVGTCGAADCQEPRVTRGYCARHAPKGSRYVGNVADLQARQRAATAHAQSSSARAAPPVFVPDDDKDDDDNDSSKKVAFSDPNSTPKQSQDESKDSSLPVKKRVFHMRRSSQSRYRGTQSKARQGVGRPYNVKLVSRLEAKGLKWTGNALENLLVPVEVLGQGAFGEVWRARHRTAGFEMAVKMVAAQTPEQIQAYKSEVSVMKQVTHPNIVGYFGCWGPDSRGLLWILMDLCEHGSVQTLTAATRTQLTEPQIAYVCACALMALVYLHAKGINHRDIKANNLLVDKDGCVKLSDFGVSNQVELPKKDKLATNTTTATTAADQDDAQADDPKEEDVMSSGGRVKPSLDRALSYDPEAEIVGTPNWLAPEIIDENVVDFKGDIWALGITAIELGETVPYDGLSWLRVIRAVKAQPPPTLKAPYWTSTYRDFVAACLVKDPTKRPTAADLLEHPFILSALSAMQTTTAGKPPSSPLLSLVKRAAYMARMQPTEIEEKATTSGDRFRAQARAHGKSAPPLPSQRVILESTYSDSEDEEEAPSRLSVAAGSVVTASETTKNLAGDSDDDYEDSAWFE